MTKFEKKLVRHLVCEILYVSFILIFLTAFWFGPRKQMQEEGKNVGYKTTGLSNMYVTNEVQKQEITVDNKDGKGDLMLVFNTTTPSSIYYQILSNGALSEERCLADDGAIYLLALEQNQKTTLEVRLWTDENEEAQGELLMLPVAYQNQV